MEYGRLEGRKQAREYVDRCQSIRYYRRWAYIRAHFPPGPCSYCGAPDVPGIDHVIPRSRGGAWWDWANLTRACIRCNGQKRNRTPDEWMAYRLARGLSWPPVENAARS